MSRTYKLAFLSLAVNIAFGGYNIVIGCVTRSWWLLTIGTYYAVLSVVRYTVLRSKKENTAFIKQFTGILLMVIATLLGGWDSALSTLVIFMGVDFVTGVVTAAMGKSKHSDSGTLNSKAGWVGLAKKFCILLMVVVGVRIDILLGTNYIRDTVCISFCLNELLSIVENTSLMGIPYPPAMKKAIDVLQTKVGRAEERIEEVKDNGNSET